MYNWAGVDNIGFESADFKLSDFQHSKKKNIKVCDCATLEGQKAKICVPLRSGGGRV